MYCSVVQFAPGSLLAAGYGKTSPANLETFAIFAFMVAWVCIFVTACPVSKQMCISARLRASAILGSQDCRGAEAVVASKNCDRLEHWLAHQLPQQLCNLGLPGHVFIAVLAGPKVGRQSC